MTVSTSSATVCVAHAEADRAFVETTLVPALPMVGIDDWQSADERAAAEVLLVVVSEALAATSSVMSLIGHARASHQHIIPVCADGTSRTMIPELAALVTAAPSGSVSSWTSVDLVQAVGALLPPRETLLASPSASGACRHPIAWDAALFSDCLEQALDRRDFNAATTLVETLIGRLARLPQVFRTERANGDLSALRRKRQFPLMRRYCRGVLHRGLTGGNLKVRRQYGQALIEGGDFEHALKVLHAVVSEAEEDPNELQEARGLIGRAYKQQYVDAPKGPGAAHLLTAAIAAYQSVYDEYPTNTWCGVNCASLLLRACRDGMAGDAERAKAHQIAGKIISQIGPLADKAPEKVEIWDLATLAEAFVALEKWNAAGVSLEAYLRHPKMDAFEVSSTCRQFEQVLQARGHPFTEPLLDRLWQAVRRYRAGGATLRSAADGPSGTPVLIRVADPNWEPKDIPGVILHARLGTVISARCSAAAIEGLLEDPNVISIEESRATGPLGGPDTSLECARSVPFIGVAATYGPAGPTAYSEKGDRALIAVLDNGIDVLHQAFLDDKGRSRIVAIWDQRTPPNGKARPPEGFSYGTEHTAPQIAEYVARKSVPDPLGRNIGGHGTRVASIAAGRGAGAFAGGVAPEAAILVVITNSGDEALGYSTAHVDALTYVDRVATRLGLPVVVNVSQGMNAGAHDGKSTLEVAFDNFSGGGRTAGRVIVKSAGNERDKKSHATVAIGRMGADRFRWRRQSPRPSREHLEFWSRSANDFRYRLTPPGGEPLPWVSEASPEFTGILAGNTDVSLTFIKRHPDNGDDLLRVKISGDDIPIGTWTLDVEALENIRDGKIHAWIEKTMSDRPTSFEDHDHEEVTLSVPGTAANVITVAAVSAAFPLRVGDFSSYGPTRDGRHKPEISAPGIDIKAARGGTESDAMPDSGTSMAAPHVAGAIALLLSRRAKKGARFILNSAQIAAALQDMTLNRGAQWTAGLGYGVPDVAALLAAFP